MSYSPRNREPLDPLLAPARRAGLLMLILGGLGFLSGTCMVGIGFINPANLAALNAKNPMGPQAQIPPQAWRVSGGIMLAISLALLVMGFLARRGRRGIVIRSLILTCLLLLFELLGLFDYLAMAANGNVTAIIGIVTCLAVLTALAVLAAWLVQAVRVSGQVQANRSADVARQQQSQQLRQTYGNIPEPPPGQAPPPVGPGQWPLQPPAPPKE